MISRQANRYPTHGVSISRAICDGPGRSPSRPASTGARGSSFAQDFNLEHSRSGAASATRVLSAQASSSQTTQRSTPKSADASPNCIYLG
jgi:hypothetical protein